MIKFRINLILFIICFLCTAGFTIASKVSGIEVVEHLALTFAMMTLYLLGWFLGFNWCYMESEKYKTVYPLMKAKLDKVSNENLELKEVLEIIKKKWVDISRLEYAKTLEEYNEYNTYYKQELTQEEFDLLKEVLK